jgi:hypothetical protein
MAGNGGWRGRERRRWRPRNRAVGCLLWIVAALVILLLLSVLFGGFQTGKKAGSGPGSGPRERAHPAAQELQLGRIAALS